MPSISARHFAATEQQLYRREEDGMTIVKKISLLLSPQFGFTIRSDFLFIRDV